jgi:hypothetical protein
LSVSIFGSSERPADALPNGTRAIELHQFVADAAGAQYSRAEHGGGKTWHLVTVLFEMNFATYEWRKVRFVAVCLWGRRSSGSGYETCVSEFCTVSPVVIFGTVIVLFIPNLCVVLVSTVILQLRRRQTIPEDRLEIVLNALHGPSLS